MVSDSFQPVNSHLLANHVGMTTEAKQSRGITAVLTV